MLDNGAVGSDDAEIVRGAFEMMSQAIHADEDEQARLAERWWHLEIEYVDDPSWPDSSSYRGRENVRQAFDGYRELLDVETSVEEVRNGSNGIFAKVLFAGRSTGAELPWEQRFGYLCRVRDGKLAYARAYLDVEEARRDSGASSS
jgi:ketosteroid isomerase-like protein